MKCHGVVGVFWLVLGRWSRELVSLLLYVCWDTIVFRGKVGHWGLLLRSRGFSLVLTITCGVRYFLAVYDFEFHTIFRIP